MKKWWAAQSEIIWRISADEWHAAHLFLFWHRPRSILNCQLTKSFVSLQQHGRHLCCCSFLIDRLLSLFLSLWIACISSRGAKNFCFAIVTFFKRLLTSSTFQKHCKENKTKPHPWKQPDGKSVCVWKGHYQQLKRTNGNGIKWGPISFWPSSADANI